MTHFIKYLRNWAKDDCQQACNPASWRSRSEYCRDTLCPLVCHESLQQPIEQQQPAVKQQPQQFWFRSEGSFEEINEV